MTKLREPVSSLTHFIGFLLCIPAIYFMVHTAYEEVSFTYAIPFFIFGISLLLLYGASAVYHGLNIQPKKIEALRRIDHMMIFVLIAGTYTPVCLIPLKGKVGWTLLIFVWGFAALGILLKAFWLNAPRWLSTAIYVFMGWLVLFAFFPLEKAISLGGIALLAAGGISYTAGAVIYAVKWPKLNFKNFGFHEIFHLFVMGGSFCHILFMFQYVI